MLWKRSVEWGWCLVRPHGPVIMVWTTVCIRERDGGVNGAVVIIKLHKMKFRQSKLYYAMLPCWPSSCPSPAVSTLRHTLCRRSAANTAVAPFPPRTHRPKGPVNVQQGQSNRIVVITSSILLVVVVIILFAVVTVIGEGAAAAGVAPHRPPAHEALMKASTGLFASRDASSFLSLVRCSIRLNLRASLAWVFVSTISPPV